MRRFLVLLALAVYSSLPAAGQGLIDVTITGSSISVSVSAPAGLGVDLNLGFEDVAGLTLANLGLSAQVVNPLDPALRARLPTGAVIPALPILLRIEPPAAGGLSFRGVASSSSIPTTSTTSRTLRCACSPRRSAGPSRT